MNKIIISISLILTLSACKKEETTPSTSTTDLKQEVTLVDTTKGFKKIYSYVESSMPTINKSRIYPLDLSFTNENQLNIGFHLKIENGESKSLYKASVNATTGTIINQTQPLSILWPTYYEGEFFSFVPYSDKLTYSYYHGLSTGVYYNTIGDITESTGINQMGKIGRVAKTGHLTISPWGLSGGSTWYKYGLMNAGKYFPFSYTGSESTQFHEGFLEPISNTNTGIVILYSKNGVTAYEQDLSDSTKAPTQVSTVSLTMPMGGSNVFARKTIIKNNASDNNFSFAYYEDYTLTGERLIWTFKYDYTTKTLTKVSETGLRDYFKILDSDVDADGNYYFTYGAADSYAVKKITGKTVSILGKENFTLAGKPNLIRWFDNKVFVGVSRDSYQNKNNGTDIQTVRQLDVFVIK